MRVLFLSLLALSPVASRIVLEADEEHVRVKSGGQRSYTLQSSVIDLQVRQDTVSLGDQIWDDAIRNDGDVEIAVKIGEHEHDFKLTSLRDSVHDSKETKFSMGSNEKYDMYVAVTRGSNGTEMRAFVSPLDGDNTSYRMISFENGKAIVEATNPDDRKPSLTLESRSRDDFRHLNESPVHYVHFEGKNAFDDTSELSEQTIDVMFTLTNPQINNAMANEMEKNEIIMAVDMVNQDLKNSRVNFSVRAHITTRNEISNHSERKFFELAPIDLIKLAQKGKIPGLNEYRDSLGADMVVLVTNFQDKGYLKASDIAYESHRDPDFAYAQLDISTLSQRSLTNVMKHALGCKSGMDMKVCSKIMNEFGSKISNYRTFKGFTDLGKDKTMWTKIQDEMKNAWQWVKDTFALKL